MHSDQRQLLFPLRVIDECAGEGLHGTERCEVGASRMRPSAWRPSVYTHAGSTAEDVPEGRSVAFGAQRPGVGDAVQGPHDSVGHAEKGLIFSV